MMTKSDPHNVPPAIQKIAAAFQIGGMVGLWAQIGAAFAAGVALIFAAFGRNFSEDPSQGIGVGIFWAVCGLLVLGAGLFWSLRYTLVARGLRSPEPSLHPRKADTIKLLRVGILVGLAGTAIALLGSGFTIGVLVAKTVSQPPGVAITDPNKIVRALDVFVVMANVLLIAAHFVGTVTSLWLLDRIHHHHR